MYAVIFGSEFEKQRNNFKPPRLFAPSKRLSFPIKSFQISTPLLKEKSVNI